MLLLGSDVSYFLLIGITYHDEGKYPCSRERLMIMEYEYDFGDKGQDNEYRGSNMSAHVLLNL